MPSPDGFGWGPPCPERQISAFEAGGIALTAQDQAIPLFKMFIEEIVSRGYPVAGNVRDDWGYNCRRIAGSSTFSYHAWGLAIDLNALRNPMGPDLITDMPAWIDEVAFKYGLVWGGNFNRRKDAMHFELHLSQAEAAERIELLGEGSELTDPEWKRLEALLDKYAKYVTRWVDHGDNHVPGTGNHHDRIREELADIKARLIRIEQGE